ncbi:OsmC family protein [Jiulongibacter sediminis]|uniref:Peroxiredoxin n=1 Tax=Jiulongibacter sediminis TaxID=1605367 RepID=A0A0P7C6U4_9BACT|nr:OsmC family protein [Jiulongibacter sediminis]KPM49150.1 peroxiredoxin [Jiulongibacter sediminis]TBX26205.1 peroxiredoxin [Jiulongibacter sediminis]
MKEHHYHITTEWTGNTGEGTISYKSYERSHLLKVDDKTVIELSSDPAFRGDPAKHNPEELFLASLSSCHMLWYLHFCSVNGITVTSYLDKAEGLMEEEKSGKGRFKTVLLKPQISIREPEKLDLALELHHKANEFCFIANSCNFEVKHEPRIRVEP